MKKVKEPNPAETWECPRCYQDYCGDCVDKVEVDFEIEDTCFREDYLIPFKKLLVCPWCYNQLIDLKKKNETQQQRV